MENSVTFDPGLDYGATFRFPVTWSYISSEPAPKTVSKTAPVPVLAPEPVQPKIEPPASIPVLVPTKKTADPPALKSDAGTEAKWEMVIPKMARPVPARPRALQAPAPVSIKEEQPPNSDPENPTEISFYADSEASFVPRRWKVWGLTAAVVVVGFAIVLVRPGSQSAYGNDPAPAAAGTWSRRTTFVVGAKDPRDLVVYSGSDGLKNYRIEFSWVPDSLGVGWIFRATDSANYYASKIRLLQAGTLSLEHFAVLRGLEGTHSRKVITLGRTNDQVLVRMDAMGPAFTLYLQGSPADYWTDEHFDTGSLGFFEDRGERPVVQALRFTLFKKTGLQTVMTSLQ